MITVFKIQIFFEESHKRMRAESEQTIQWLISQGFDTHSSYFEDTFLVYYEGNENDKNIFRKKLDLYLLAMSERNCSDCALLITEEIQNCEKVEASTWYLVSPSDNGMMYFKNFVKANDEFYERLKELRLFYAQVEPYAKLIYGISLLEEWFDTKPEHCLTKREQENIMRKINELELDDKKKKRIESVIKDSSFLSKKNRNQRIAAAVHKYLGSNEDDAAEKIRKLYKARAKSAHSTDDKNMELPESLEFLKSIFRVFLYDKYNFIKIKLH